MVLPQPVPISKLITALLDDSTPFHPRYLSRLSDLDPADSTSLRNVWHEVSAHRRQALLEDLEEAHIADDLLNYEAVARIALSDPLPVVRMLAISILREYELVELMGTFMEMSENDPDVDVRASAAAALGTYVYMGEVDEISFSRLERVEKVLFRIISGADAPQVQRKALESLGYSSRDDVSPLIEKAYSSTDIQWIATSLLAMGRSANPIWKRHVLKMLAHTQPLLRAEAASAAGELELSDAVPVLLELLDDSDMDVRMAAIWSLSQVGGSGVRAALENHLEVADNDEEANQVNSALENLEFTDELREIALLEIQDDEDEDEMGSSDDDYFGIDGDHISEDETD